MSKSWKDIKKFDIKQVKRNARETFNEVNMRERVKPLEKKGKGGAKNWKELLNNGEEE